MKKQHILGLAVGASFLIASGLMMKGSGQKQASVDDALLAIIKNDKAKFDEYLLLGGKIQADIDLNGKKSTLLDMIIEHERMSFIPLAEKEAFQKDPLFWRMLAARNNQSLFKDIHKKFTPVILESFKYEHERNMLHVVSAECHHQVAGYLEKNKMKWSDKDKKGYSALTLAAESGCLPLLSYWKTQKANFLALDGRGINALQILLKKNDPALLAFGKSFEVPRTAISVPNFYNKRKIPKAKLADRSHLIEPESRPDEAYETSAFSEFSD